MAPRAIATEAPGGGRGLDAIACPHRGMVWLVPPKKCRSPKAPLSIPSLGTNPPRETETQDNKTQRIPSEAKCPAGGERARWPEMLRHDGPRWSCSNFILHQKHAKQITKHPNG